MIKISDKPSKKVEHFTGTITMAFPSIENKVWNFTVLRITNGSTTFAVEADHEQFEQHFDDQGETDYFKSMLEETVKANLAKEQAEWKPAEK
jgi:hypothetical protein